MIEEDEEQQQDRTEVTPLLLLSLYSSANKNKTNDEADDTDDNNDEEDYDFEKKNLALLTTTTKASTTSTRAPLLLPKLPKPVQVTPLYRLTVLTWFCMISFGLFATFQYVVPAIATVSSTGWYYYFHAVDDDDDATTTTYQQERWDKTDPGLYRTSTTTSSGTANSLMLVHLICGIYLMFVGPIQLVPWIRQNYLNVHRWIGRIYILTALIASSCATTWVIVFHTSRFWIHEDVGNITFGIAAFISSIQSYRYIRLSVSITATSSTSTDYTKNREKYIQLHKLWSFRLFGVIFGAALYRIWSWPFYLLGTVILPPVGNLDPHPIISITFYLLFVPSWIVIELIYRKKWKPSNVVLQWSFGILLALLLPILCLTWIPAMLNLPTVQEQILKS